MQKLFKLNRDHFRCRSRVLSDFHRCEATEVICTAYLMSTEQMKNATNCVALAAFFICSGARFLKINVQKPCTRTGRFSNVLFGETSVNVAKGIKIGCLCLWNIFFRIFHFFRTHRCTFHCEVQPHCERNSSADSPESIGKGRCRHKVLYFKMRRCQEIE